MKGKYITTDIRMACLSKPLKHKKDIHAQFAETIAERKRITQQLTKFVETGRVPQMYLIESNAA